MANNTFFAAGRSISTSYLEYAQHILANDISDIHKNCCPKHIKITSLGVTLTVFI